MSERIDHNRRRFLGLAAMSIVAAGFGVIGSANAQSGKTKPASQPTTEAHQMTVAAVQLPIEGELPSIRSATGWLNSRQERTPTEGTFGDRSVGSSEDWREETIRRAARDPQRGAWLGTREPWLPVPDRGP